MATEKCVVARYKAPEKPSCLRPLGGNNYLIIKGQLLLNRMGTLRVEHGRQTGVLVVFFPSGEKNLIRFQLNRQYMHPKDILERNNIHVDEGTIFKILDGPGNYYDLVALVGFTMPDLYIQILTKITEPEYTGIPEEPTVVAISC